MAVTVTRRRRVWPVVVAVVVGSMAVGSVVVRACGVDGDQVSGTSAQGGSDGSDDVVTTDAAGSGDWVEVGNRVEELVRWALEFQAWAAYKVSFADSEPEVPVWDEWSTWVTDEAFAETERNLNGDGARRAFLAEMAAGTRNGVDGSLLAVSPLTWRVDALGERRWRVEVWSAVVTWLGSRSVETALGTPRFGCQLDVFEFVETDRSLLIDTALWRAGASEDVPCAAGIEHSGIYLPDSREFAEQLRAHRPFIGVSEGL